MSILIYRGEGAGLRSVCSTTESITRLIQSPLLLNVLPRRNLQVATLSAEQLLAGALQKQEAALLVMPGGADLPYCAALNGRGNELIRRFVRGGGSYLGLCAGAYYACARVEFEPSTALEVVGDRELAFFPGTARGAAFPGFDYQSEAGAVAARVCFRPHARLAQAATGHSPTSSSSGWIATLDYCNGGPVFTCGSQDVEQLPGVTVLACYLDPAAAPKQQQQQSDVGPQQPPHAGQRVAAVRCQAGRGVAVLCATHPELSPAWLDVCGESSAQQGPCAHPQQAGAAAAAGGSVSSAVAISSPPKEGGGAGVALCANTRLAAHAQQLQKQLREVQQERDLFLASLLAEALLPAVEG